MPIRLSDEVRQSSVAVLDLGIGNWRSVANTLRSLGEAVSVLETGQDLSRWRCVFIPGVGRFDPVVQRLRGRGWEGPIHEYARSEAGLLIGICLGAHILGLGSDEGREVGLQLLPFKARRFTHDAAIKVPFIGWDRIATRGGESWRSRDHEGPFYFSHSFFMDAPMEITQAWTEATDVPAVVGHGSVIGLQFHPEKSGTQGRRLLADLVGF